MAFSSQHLLQLKEFIKVCKETPTVLHQPELAFFRQYLESMGAKLPPKPEGEKTPDAESPKSEKSPDESKETPQTEEIVESDIEIDDPDVIEPDNDDPLPYGDAEKEVTEEEMDKADEKRSEAMQNMSAGEYKSAIDAFGEAIVLNPGSAALYAKRANCLLKMNKPNACIKDCDKAIELNPDNAQAYKYRGRAHRLLGHWEEAAKDLGTACRIDYDDEANEWLKEVQPNAKKISEHRRKYERLYEEKRIREHQERLKKIREEREKASKEAQGDSDPLGGFPGGGGMPDMSQILSDPEIMQAFQDPEVAAAFQDVSQNPANLLKYQNNPKVTSLMAKIAQKMGGGAKPPGGFPGGFSGGFPGGFPGFSA